MAELYIQQMRGNNIDKEKNGANGLIFLYKSVITS